MARHLQRPYIIHGVVQHDWNYDNRVLYRDWDYDVQQDYDNQVLDHDRDEVNREHHFDYKDKDL